MFGNRQRHELAFPRSWFEGEGSIRRYQRVGFSLLHLDMPLPSLVNTILGAGLRGLNRPEPSTEKKRWPVPFSLDAGPIHFEAIRVPNEGPHGFLDFEVGEKAPELGSRPLLHPVD